MVGDVVDVPDVGRGKIVAILDEKIYSQGYLEGEWRFLRNGVLLEIEDMGLVHYESDFDRQWHLVSR